MDSCNFNPNLFDQEENNDLNLNFMSAYPSMEHSKNINSCSINSNRTSITTAITNTSFTETDRISTKIFSHGIPSPCASKIINYENFEKLHKR